MAHQYTRTRQSPFGHSTGAMGNPAMASAAPAASAVDFDFDQWETTQAAAPAVQNNAFGHQGSGGYAYGQSQGFNQPAPAQSAFPSVQSPGSFGGGVPAPGAFGGGVQAPGAFGGGVPAPGAFGGGVQAPGMGGGVQAPGMGGGVQAPGMNNASFGQANYPSVQPPGQTAQQPFNPKPAQTNGMQDFNNLASEAASQFGVNPLVSTVVTEMWNKGIKNDQVKEAQGMLGKWLPSANVKNYFRVTHNFVLEKFRFLLMPYIYIQPRKTLTEEMARPDLYVPLMGFITYVLLYSLNLGVHQQFTPTIFSSAATFAGIIHFLEIFCGWVSFMAVGTSNITFMDLMAYTGYKYVHLVIWLFICLSGLADGLMYYPLIAYFAACSSLSLFFLLGRIEPGKEQNGQMVSNPNVMLHKNVIFVLTGVQAFSCWLLSPSLARLQETSYNATSSTHYPPPPYDGPPPPLEY